MTDSTLRTPDLELVDEGWGRRAVDFATLSEPGNCRDASPRLVTVARDRNPDSDLRVGP
jgi:hypothetical protein